MLLDIPSFIKASAIVAGCAGVTVFALHQVEKAEQRGYARANTDWEARYATNMARFNDYRAKEAEDARRRERVAYENVRELQEKHRVAIENAAKSGRAAERELDALRVLLAEQEAHGLVANCPLPGATSDSGPASAGHGAAATGGLLGACATELVSVAQDADRLKAQVITLQDYARDVTALHK